VSEIEEYINCHEGVHKLRLEEMRTLLKKLMPQAEECISYKMPAFRTTQVVCCYAAYKHHIGFYPTSKPISQFSEALKKYKHSKGAVQFQIKEPLPTPLIMHMILFRLAEIKRSS
jgi:uncharacterized protein YdhG (YjbR/CyaY superfamily)